MPPASTTGRMTDVFTKNAPGDRDIEQAITALKKGATLLKYGRRGKPKFCPFKLSADETELIWYSGPQEKTLKLKSVTSILHGQRTPVFNRYPRAHLDSYSFSLIYNNGERSLDLICKDKDEADVWFTGLRALINGQARKPKDRGLGSLESSPPPSRIREGSTSLLSSPFGSQDDLQAQLRATPPTSPPPVFLDGPRSGDRMLSPYASPPHGLDLGDGLQSALLPLPPAVTQIVRDGSEVGSDSGSSSQFGVLGSAISRVQFFENSRLSVSSQVSTSSQGSGMDDSENLGDVYMWGEGIGDGVLGGGQWRIGSGGPGAKLDALLPKALESTVVLDVQMIACGGRHSTLVNRQGEVFSWGEECGGRLGHGVDVDVMHPQLVEALSNTLTDTVACGEYHTCAVTAAGELYTWGDGSHGCGLLGHGNDFSQWVPKRVLGPLDGLRVTQVACGPWHTAAVTSNGQLFTFGDGTFGALGHGDRSNAALPREVEALKGSRVIKVACGVWHTAAVVETLSVDSSVSSCASGRLYTWGDGDKGRLGHGNKEAKWVPTFVHALADHSIVQVACGHSLTVALTSMGQVHTFGSSVYGQLGVPNASGKLPALVEGKLKGQYVDFIACGAQHVAVVTNSKGVYTWGKGANGRLGHGDVKDRDSPALVEALKDKHVTHVACGSSFTAVICLHKWVSGADHSQCTACKSSFGLTKRRHNCYNCGMVFCHSCSSKKQYKASMASNPHKPARVCDNCFVKLAKAQEAGMSGSYRGGKNKWKSQGHKISIDGMDKSGKPPMQFKVGSEGDLMTLKGSQMRNPRKRSESRGRASVTPLNGTWGAVYPPAPFNHAFVPPGLPCAPVPAAPSPRSPTPPRRPSPTRLGAMSISSGSASPRKIVEDLKKTNDAMGHEVLNLRSKIKDLNERLPEHARYRTSATGRTSHPVNGIEQDREPTSNARRRFTMSPTGPMTRGSVDLANDPASLRPPDSNGMATPVQDAPTPRSLVRSTRVSRSSDGNETTRSLDRTVRRDDVTRSSHNLPLLSIPGPNHGTSLSNGGGASTPQASGSANAGGSHTGRQGHSHSGSGGGGAVSGSGRSQEREWVEQVEPGVYITLLAHPSGGNELRRIRFSRKIFSERQAEQWWAENRPRVLELYNIRSPERNPADRATTPPRPSSAPSSPRGQGRDSSAARNAVPTGVSESAAGSFSFQS
ncbi:hypothetical protein CBR_g38446 [Chara braunii]|uniref:FYVE-type domain-containing protein n=1 Tax=Chara braunii TaxID=69332 RepID=A0A388JNR6_CHABU|nr:hypothetical protein CBR_g38446 [Chara braunii]|eukprot:GBG59421.1 hypothetical protein CBR_g38446 [Chara braunii]